MRGIRNFLGPAPEVPRLRLPSPPGDTLSQSFVSGCCVVDCGEDMDSVPEEKVGLHRKEVADAPASRYPHHSGARESEMPLVRFAPQSPSETPAVARIEQARCR